MVTSRHGRYMIFFPSYSYMQSVYDIYIKKYENTILELSAALNDENSNDENTAKKGQEQQREQQKYGHTGVPADTDRRTLWKHLNLPSDRAQMESNWMYILPQTANSSLCTTKT